MKRLALLLCLAASAAWAVSTITLQPGESITVTAAPASSGGTTPPSGGGGTPAQPIPGVPMTLTLDGVVRDTNGLNTSQMTAVGSFVVPNRVGMSSQFKSFEHGQASLWRWGWLTRDPSTIDAQHPQAQGTGINLSFIIGVQRQGYVTVQPGEVIFIVLRNQKFNGSPSCTAGLACDTGYSVDVPS